MQQQDEYFMRAAISQAKLARQHGDMPFGAVVARRGALVAAAYNTELLDADVTSHAEIKAISLACRAIGSRDLSDCMLYSTCEPCHMCATAAFIARIPRIVYGSSRDDLPHLFRKRSIRIAQLADDTAHPSRTEGGTLKKEAAELFRGIEKPFGLPKNGG